MISVLYVDDEPGLLEIGKLYLEQSGEMQVKTVESPFEALEELGGAEYACIISDYQMPKMDGIEFLKEVRSRHGKIPFILFTGRGREEVVIEALNNGADFYLQKGGYPAAQFAELTHKVRMAVEHYESEKLYRAIFETTGTAMTLLEDNTVISLVNTKFEQLSGFNKSEIEGRMRWTEFVMKEDLDRMIALHKMRLKDEKATPNQYEFRFITRTGDIRTIFLTINMIPGSKRYVASLMDITELKKMEDVLKRTSKDGSSGSPETG
jgi:PAS domain S-box-containing protein